MTSLLLLPLDDTVVFPTMDVTLPVDAGDEERVLLIPRHDGEFAKVGTIAEVTDHIRLPGGGSAVALSGVARGVAGADDRIGAFLRAIADPGPLADTIGYAPDVSFEDKVAALETLDVTERLELV